MEFELVVPAYNEEKNLPLLIERAKNAAVQYGYTPQNFQFVVVNNGSTDGSQAVLERLKSGNLAEWFRVVNVSVNQGYGFGVWQGLQSTTAAYVGWSHADMQCDPADAFRALVLLKEQAMPPKTLVKGVRYQRSWKDQFVSRVLDLFALLILHKPFYEINAQPKVFPRILLSHLANPPFTFAFDIYLLYQAKRQGFRFLTIPVQFPPRIHGFSNWSTNFVRRYATILGFIGYLFRLRFCGDSLDK